MDFTTASWFFALALHFPLAVLSKVFPSPLCGGVIKGDFFTWLDVGKGEYSRTTFDARVWFTTVVEEYPRFVQIKV